MDTHTTECRPDTHSKSTQQQTTEGHLGANAAGEHNIRLFSQWQGNVDAFKSVDPSERTVISYGFPGSGSTLIWQILEFLIGGVKKTSSCPIFRNNTQVVASVRDFRDILCTYLARTSMAATRENIDELVNSIAHGGGVFAELDLVTETWKASEGRILWMRYEDFFNNYDYIFERIEKFLQRPISVEERREIAERFNHDSNRARAQKARSLTEMDDGKDWLEMEWHSYVVDGINARHITSDGTPGKWRQIIPEGLHDHVTELLREPLRRFGYI